MTLRGVLETALAFLLVCIIGGLVGAVIGLMVANGYMRAVF